MDYKNLIKRSFVSFFFIFIYLLLNLYSYESIFYLVVILYFLIFSEIIIFFKKYKYIMITYLLISFLLFLNIKFNQSSFFQFNLMIIAIISFDIFSYIVGKSIGKNKILPSLSPNKTLEGFIGGLLFSFITSYLYCLIFDNYNINNLIFIIIIIFSAFTGDIVQSFFKRKNNLKDSSNFLPGHGGFFDRFDSFIFSIITYYIYFILL